jgi:hypothetical protein
MNELDYKYHWENLEALDPDQLVSDLNLSSEEILSAFKEKADRFIEETFG